MNLLVYYVLSLIGKTIEINSGLIFGVK